MKISMHSSAAVFAVMMILAAGCSTTTSRIDKNQTAFAAASPDVQAKIRAGHVDVGFTIEQVMMALGEPDRRFTRTTEKGVAEVWAYADHGPAFSFGMGVGGGGGSTSVGTGVMVNTGGNRDSDRIRVVFDGGRVSALEKRGR
jgi:hypothetical protein